jgi:hypothetical protein
VSCSIGSWRTPPFVVEDDARLRHRELVALAAHVLEQDREVQLAAAGDLEDALLGGVAHAQRDVRLQLAVEPVADLPAGDELAFATGERRRVDAEVHRQRRLVDLEHRQRRGPLGVGDRLADADVLDAVDEDDVARPRLVGLLPLEAFELQHWLMRALRGSLSMPAQTTTSCCGLSVPG